MTSQSQQQQGQEPSEGMTLLIARVVSDPEFRQQLVDNPEQAIASGEFPLSAEERRVITSTSREEREQMMTQLSERTSPAVCVFWSLIVRKQCLLNSTLQI